MHNKLDLDPGFYSDMLALTYTPTFRARIHCRAVIRLLVYCKKCILLKEMSDRSSVTAHMSTTNARAS